MIYRAGSGIAIAPRCHIYNQHRLYKIDRFTSAIVVGSFQVKYSSNYMTPDINSGKLLTVLVIS